MGTETVARPAVEVMRNDQRQLQMADNGLSLELPGRLGNVCVKDHDPMYSFEPICAHCASEEIQDDPSTVCNLPGKGTFCLNQAAPK